MRKLSPGYYVNGKREKARKFVMEGTYDEKVPWESFQFSKVEMQFGPSSGIELALESAIDAGAESIGFIAKRRYLETLEKLRAKPSFIQNLGTKRRIATFSKIEQHVPNEVAVSAQSFATSNQIDAIVVVGGGSAVGTGKVMALALADQRPFIAVPTTFSGSEMTPIYGVTTKGNKVTTRDERVRPTKVIYDRSLLQSLPPSIAIASVANAFAHACEALWVPTASRTSSIFARGALEALAVGLKDVTSAPTFMEGLFDAGGALDEITYGAAMAGMAFGHTGSGIHHKICHLIGGAYNLDHANTHMIVGKALLPEVADLYSSRDAESIRQITECFGKLMDAYELPKTLVEIGLDTSLKPSLISEVEELSRRVTPSLEPDRIRRLFEQITG